MEVKSSVQIASEALQKFEYIEENVYKGSTEGLAMIDDMMPCVCKYDESTIPENKIKALKCIHNHHR